MVRFVDKPYTSGSVRGKLSSIKWKMACGIGMTNLHFVTLADNSDDLFDIYPAAVFKQKIMRKSDRVIIGVADSHRSAVELVEMMVKDCIDNCGDLSGIRSYFSDFVRDHV